MEITVRLNDGRHRAKWGAKGLNEIEGKREQQDDKTAPYSGIFPHA